MSHIMHVCAWWLYYRAETRSCDAGVSQTPLVAQFSEDMCESSNRWKHSHACNSRMHMQTYAFMQVIQVRTHACIQLESDIAEVLRQTDRVDVLPFDGRRGLVCKVNVPTTAPMLSPWKQACVCVCPSRVFSTHLLTLFVCPTFILSSVILTLLPPTARFLPHFTPPSKTPLSLSLSLTHTHLFIFTHSVCTAHVSESHRNMSGSYFTPQSFIWFY